MTISFMDRFRPQRPAQTPLVFDGLAQVRAYWESLRRNGDLPPRSALDPRGLGGVLDRVLLGQRIGRGVLQVRVAGSALAEFAGMDARGLPLSCLFAVDSRPLLSAAIEQVCSDPAVVEIDLGSDRAPSGGLIARLLLLPLADEGGTKLILGAISFAPGPTARCKFQIRGSRDERLPRPPMPEVETPVVKAPVVQTPVVQTPVVQPIRRYGHLSLVHVSE